MAKQITLLFLALAGLLLSGMARAGYLLNTGTPSETSALLLSGNDWYAAEFTVSGSQRIHGIFGYLTAGNSGAPGDTFTVALYEDAGDRPSGSALYSAQATFVADGWNGAAGLLWDLAPGNYWVAFEVGALDDTAGLLMPLAAPNPALRTAFYSGFDYEVTTGMDFGVQVVPAPSALLLLGQGLVLLAGTRKGKRSA